MNRINRNTFIKNSLTLATVAWLSPFNQLVAAGTNSHGAEDFGTDQNLMKRLLIANDQLSAVLLQSGISNKVTRRVGYDFATLSASFCSPESTYYQSTSVVA